MSEHENDDVIVDPEGNDPDEPVLVMGETPAERQFMILAIRKAGAKEALQCAVAGAGPRFPKVCEDRAVIAELAGNPDRADSFRALKPMRHGTLVGLAQLMLWEDEAAAEAAEAAKNGDAAISKPGAVKAAKA